MPKATFSTQSSDIQTTTSNYRLYTLSLGYCLLSCKSAHPELNFSSSPHDLFPPLLCIFLKSSVSIKNLLLFPMRSFLCLENRLANDCLQAESDPLSSLPPGFVNKVSLEQSYVRLFTYSLGQRRVVATEMYIWSYKPKIVITWLFFMKSVNPWPITSTFPSSHLTTYLTISMCPSLLLIFFGQCFVEKPS